MSTHCSIQIASINWLQFQDKNDRFWKDLVSLLRPVELRMEEPRADPQLLVADNQIIVSLSCQVVGTFI